MQTLGGKWYSQRDYCKWCWGSLMMLFLLVVRATTWLPGMALCSVWPTVWWWQQIGKDPAWNGGDEDNRWKSRDNEMRNDILPIDELEYWWLNDHRSVIFKLDLVYCCSEEPGPLWAGPVRTRANDKWIRRQVFQPPLRSLWDRWTAAVTMKPLNRLWKTFEKNTLQFTCMESVI